MNPQESRGYQNKNPGNIDRGRDIWQGEIRDPADPRLSDFQKNELTTGRFCTFAQHEWGIRAIIRNLMSYQTAGWNTINTMIDHWAPPSDNNDTAAYKASVSKSTGKGLDDPLDMMKYAEALGITDAIIKVECAGNPYSSDQMEDGLRLAGVVKPVGVTTSATATAATTGSISTILNLAITSIQDQLHDALTQITAMAGSSQVIDHIIIDIRIALSVVTLVSIGTVVWERIKRAQRDRKIDPNPSFVGQ